MVRVQVQPTEEQARALKELAGNRGVSLAELVRQSVDRLLKECGGQDEEKRRRALAPPTFPGGPSDVSVNHDEYLAEDFM